MNSTTIPYVDIINDLNAKTEKAFKCTTRSTRDFIRARWNEGWRLPDFKRVHSNKAADWKGDPKMSRFLRPETLYGNKFEGYLNEKGKKNGKNVQSKYGHLGKNYTV